MIHRPPVGIDEGIKLATEDRPLLEKAPHSKGYSRTDTVRHIYSEFRQRESVTMSNRLNENENHGIYNGIGFGQWPQQVLDDLLKNGKSKKDLSQFNFVFKKVNDVVGYLIRNWYDIDYASIDGEGVEALQYMKDLYFSDKDLCDWETELNDFLTNGCIYSGELLMTVDYRHDNKFGNIGVKSMPPGSVLRDVNWTSKNSGDCRNAYTITYMTPKEIQDRYKLKNDRIDMLIKLKQMQETERDVYQGHNIAQFDMDEEYNKVYRVIEYHHMETEKRTKRLGITSFGQFVEVPEDASDEWFQYNTVDPENLIEDEDIVDVYYITTICPELDPEEPLEDRRGLLQMGRLPLIHWSYGRQNGIDLGVVDLLKDPQRYYNQMMSLTHEIIAFARRVRLVDPGLFGDEITDIQEIEEKLSTPGATVMTDSGALLEYGDTGIQEASPSTYTGNELNLAQTVKMTADTLTPVNASLSGESESGVRSAKHFDGQREQGEVNMTVLTDSVKAFNRELAECYFYASRSLYGGLYRKFYGSEGAVVEVNKPLADGSVANDISRIPRARVIITESPEGVTRRINARTIAFAALNQVGNSDPFTANIFLEAIFETMDHLDPVKKQELLEQFPEQREILKAQQKATLAQTQAMIAQTDMQSQQLAVQNQQMVKQPQEGKIDGNS